MLLTESQCAFVRACKKQVEAGEGGGGGQGGRDNGRESDGRPLCFGAVRQVWRMIVGSRALGEFCSMLVTLCAGLARSGICCGGAAGAGSACCYGSAVASRAASSGLNTLVALSLGTSAGNF